MCEEAHRQLPLFVDPGDERRGYVYGLISHMRTCFKIGFTARPPQQSICPSSRSSPPRRRGGPAIVTMSSVSTTSFPAGLAAPTQPQCSARVGSERGGMSPQFPPKGKSKRTVYPPISFAIELWAGADLAADIRSYQDRWRGQRREHWPPEREAEVVSLEARILAIPAVAAVNDVCRTASRGWLDWLGRSMDRRYGLPRHRPPPERRRLSA